MPQHELSMSADQQMSEIDLAAVGTFALIVEDVEVIAAHPVHHLGPALAHLVTMPRREVADQLRDLRGAAGEG